METTATAKGEAVLTVMVYDESDPLAVEFDFANGDTIVPWNFARDLLHDAFRDGHAGLGDVQFSLDGETLHMCLNGTDETLLLDYDAADVQEFLVQTERIVPTGTEFDHVDLVAELDAWRDAV